MCRQRLLNPRNFLNYKIRPLLSTTSHYTAILTRRLRIASANASPMAYSISPSLSSCSSRSSLDASIPRSGDTPLRIFLVQTAKGLFSSSGGYKANLCFLRYLASRGHSVRQICYSHRGEVDAYIRTLAKSGEWDPQRCTRQLHLRSEDGREATNIKVEELILEDGVQIVALDKEAFDEAFGGKENILEALSKETADYVEVSEPNYLWSTLVSFCADIVSFDSIRKDHCRHDYWTSSHSCNRKSYTSRPHTSFSTMACP